MTNYLMLNNFWFAKKINRKCTVFSRTLDDTASNERYVDSVLYEQIPCYFWIAKKSWNLINNDLSLNTPNDRYEVTIEIDKTLVRKDMLVELFQPSWYSIWKYVIDSEPQENFSISWWPSHIHFIAVKRDGWS